MAKAAYAYAGRQLRVGWTVAGTFCSTDIASGYKLTPSFCSALYTQQTFITCPSITIPIKCQLFNKARIPGCKEREPEFGSLLIRCFQYGIIVNLSSKRHCETGTKSGSNSHAARLHAAAIEYTTLCQPRYQKSLNRIA